MNQPLKKDSTFDNMSKISKLEEKTNDLEVCEKEIVSTKKVVLKIEIIVIIGVALLTISELTFGLYIYSSYSLNISRNYYENLMFYVRNVDYIFQLKQISNSTCPDGYDEFNMQQIKSIEGICLFKDKQTGRNKMSYNSSLGNCTSTTLNLDKTITVNYWANSFYCKKSYSMVDVKFYFTKNECSSDLIPGTFKKNCGNYFGYNYCLSTSLQSFDETVCPFMNNFDSNHKPRKIIQSDMMQEFKIKNKILYITRIFDENEDVLRSSFFSYRLIFGNVSLPNSTTDFKNSFTSYYRNKFIDVTVNQRLTILPQEADKDEFNKFVISFLNGKIMDSVQDLEIVDLPGYSFSIRYKGNYLPNKNCIEYFSFENTGTDYISNFQLFLNHVEISVTRYFGYVIMELLYILSFFVYYRGVLIYYDLTSKDHVLRFYSDHEEVSSNTRIIFSTLILFFKLFTNLIQYFNLNNNLKFATTILNQKCFEGDYYFVVSINVFIEKVPSLINYTLICIILMGINYFLVLLLTIMEKRYFSQKRKFLNDFATNNNLEKEKRKKTKTN